MEKNKVSERLPEHGEYVLAHYCGGNWIDNKSKGKHNLVVVSFEKAKVEDNNKVPYKWRTFGPTCFFGQDIDFWYKLPDLE